MKKITENRYYFSNHIGILLIIFLISIFFVYDSFSISKNAKNSLTNILFEDFFPLITVEYESDSTIVLKGDENSLLILNGTLAPLWNAIDIVKNNGYKLKEITESGMGSQGNPTRFYAILEKEKIEEKTQSLDNQSKAIQEEINQTYENISQTNTILKSNQLIKHINNNTNTENKKIKNIIYYNYTNDIVGIKLQYPSNWYLNKEYDKVNSSCMEKICNIFLYRNLAHNDTSSIDTTNNNSVGLVILGGSINSQIFKEKCKYDTSLLEFVKFAYTTFFQNNERLFFVNDNETTISGNVSAWQLEFDIANPTNNNDDLQKGGKIWTILAINNDAFYLLEYAADEKLYDKYLPDAKKIIGSIEFIPPLEFKNIKQPSFMLSLNQEEEKQKPEQTITTINNNTDIGKKVTNGTLLVQNNTNRESLETASILDQKQQPQQPKENTTLTDTLSKSNTLKILSHESYIDSVGDMHVIGEVKNNTPNVAQYVEIIGTFYDSSNKVVGTSFVFTTPTDLEAGEIAPFDLILTDASIPIEQIERYVLKISRQ